ncbi:molybdenum ABC transporter periplasmic molybdate-binding protein [Sulfuricella denitrificans skB26]|uniref:Molybdenum ABC transporter periplasmic molybdate-binding protein n=1 Tax=Sulfuricella denitrificans (strain DSM 22764 / NBRC 105220 / skB26) TaxID=1163617 RepID=S6AG09_SULDS|nr:molybdate ABC transporter substrate-binding protein [Sulfuricella denitrificans]BAN34896.1 molybdenum ABC transporter periplasmic molybdate-binding protein [Sulfuricella denitrificans skB26]
MKNLNWTPAIFFGLLMNLATADEVHVAVASNFAAPMAKIAAEFARDTGNKALVSSGGTGKLYAQIKNGAPFEIFLSADEETPTKLENEGLGVAGSRFPYAFGRLALWSPKPGYVDPQGNIVKHGKFRHLAIASPKLAPYGRAAQEVLEKQGMWQPIQSRLVFGENIAQTHQFVSSGNAELGFVALSQIRQDNAEQQGSFWLVPQAMYTPIRQDAILLARGKGKTAAEQLLKYLKSDKATTIIKRYGYDLPK